MKELLIWIPLSIAFQLSTVCCRTIGFSFNDTKDSMTFESDRYARRTPRDILPTAAVWIYIAVGIYSIGSLILGFICLLCCNKKRIRRGIIISDNTAQLDGETRNPGTNQPVQQVLPMQQFPPKY